MNNRDTAYKIVKSMKGGLYSQEGCDWQKAIEKALDEKDVAALPKCSKCGSPKNKDVVVVSSPNEPWHDGRSVRNICTNCPWKDQLPWAIRIEDV